MPAINFSPLFRAPAHFQFDPSVVRRPPMKMNIVSVAAAGLLLLFQTACASTTEQKAEATPAKPTLSEEAQKALAQAEADAKAAKASFTLWSPADKALKDAQEAAKEGDSATVIKQSKKVSELTKLGAAQKAYPSTELK